MAKNVYKYKPELVNEVDEYLQSCGREQTKLPTVEGFALLLGVNDDTLVEWAKKYPEFAPAMIKLKMSQKLQLMDDGLYGGKEINQAMAIFLLKANHGMVETSRQELVGKDGQPLQISVKLDLAGGYLPPMGAIVTTPADGYQRSTSVQGASVAPESKKNDNSNNGNSQASSL